MSNEPPSIAPPEPLDLAVWYEVAGKLRSQFIEEGEVASARLLRRSSHLSLLSPDPFRSYFMTSCAEDEFEALLDNADLTAAMKSLLTPALELEVSKPDGHLIAMVKVTALGVTGTFVSVDQSSAILGAWLNCIYKVKELLESAKSDLIQGQRLSQSGLHRPSTVH